jgi:hypothetical protein
LMILCRVTEAAKAILAQMNLSQHVSVIQVVGFTHEIYTYILA